MKNCCYEVENYIVEYCESCCSEKFYQVFDVLEDAVEFANKKVAEGFGVIVRKIINIVGW